MMLKTTALMHSTPQIRFKVLGMMSGTSMDALDLAACTFDWEKQAQEWSVTLDSLVEIPLTPAWRLRLASMVDASAVAWFECERDWTRWCGSAVRDAFGDVQTFDLVSFSGQTIFHRPHQGWTGQLGSGAELYASLGGATPVVSDLRRLDVALGGQGAPLVPVADAILFNEFEACLNLGGFANISMDQAGQRRAWDIGPCNLVLNAFAERTGQAYDENGALAQSGSVLPDLLQRWRALPYHRQPPPKSLGVEWLESDFWPVVREWELTSPASPSDLLATAVAYMASEVRHATSGRRTLVTGGGAFNAHLLNALSASQMPHVSGPAIPIVVPSPNLIRGKEAMAFAFLGLLRWLNVPNVWPEVTGCSQAHIAGALWGKKDVSSRTPNSMQ